MGDKYRIYRVVRVPLTKKTSLIISFGCDGEYHVDSVDKASCDSDGKVTKAQNVAYIEHGFCCDSHCSSKKNYGFFLCSLHNLSNVVE